MTPAADADVARFALVVERLCGGTPARLALAVSGGPDSVAMLALGVVAFPGRVIAATVDHRLRPASADEAEMVAGICARLGVPHATLVVEAAIGPARVQEDARRHRYDLLTRWTLDAGGDVLATAHHADDQAETFLARAVRGSGVAGLAGIRARRVLTVGRDERDLPLVRPLLDWRREVLRGIVEAAGLPFVDDPGNADARFERVRVRRLLGGTPWLDPEGLARAAAHAGEADAALRAIGDWLWRTRRVAPVGSDAPDRQTWLDLGDLPREVGRRLCRAAIREVRLVNGVTRPAFSDATNIEPLLDAVAAGRPATQGGVLVSRAGPVWRFAQAPPRRGADVPDRR